MTMNKIMAKLREQNRDHFRILGICIFLSLLLVSSFAFLYFSPTLQQLLPDGGDTRKLSLLLLWITVAGCTIFTVYGANLFFRYKSKEFGVFLALGEQKSALKKQLVREVGAIIVKYAVWGIVLGLPISWLIWKIFAMFLVGADRMQYRFSVIGVAAGILFAAFLVLCITAVGARFVKRANIMEILNDQRRTELVKEIRPWTGKLGIALVLAGLLLAMGVPQLSVRLFMQLMPPVWNATWLLCLAGIYLLMLSVVGQTSKGRHPEKYYKNIISTNLMRFTARQTTKNMCVIVILIFVVLVSAFWGVMYMNSAFTSGDTARIDYRLHYPSLEEQLTKEEIHALADKHGVEITSFQEAKALQLIIRYTEKDYDDSGKYFDLEGEKLASFLSASAFTEITGIPLTVGAGGYKTVVTEDYTPVIWYGPDCLNSIINPVTGESLQPSYEGTVEFDDLTNVSKPFTFILSDEDYAGFADGLDAAHAEDMIFFNVKDIDASYDFAMEFENMYKTRATGLSDHIAIYDAREEALAEKEGKDYSRVAAPAGLVEDPSQMIDDWKYAPFMRVLEKGNAVQFVAVFVLLAVYIAIISLAACGVMSYVRSITIAMDNKKLFEDLKKLGANRDYEVRVIRSQLRKIFTYPISAGCIFSMLFCLLMCWFNDMRLTSFEVRTLGMQTFMVAAIAAFMYVIYRVSYKKMVGLTGI